VKVFNLFTLMAQKTPQELWKKLEININKT
jgi:hypothetical protein